VAASTVTLRFGPQNQYALLMPVKVADTAMVTVHDDLQSETTGLKQKQFDWMSDHGQEQQEEQKSAACS